MDYQLNELPILIPIWHLIKPLAAWKVANQYKNIWYALGKGLQ